jgi:DNA-binding transcriptional ArsR family regulator
MNDRTVMNTWQDVTVTEAPLPVRAVDDVETLKALSDPTRVAILRVLMESSPTRPPVMSVKELAERLGEPQTKLYRHVKQLEARGLIRVAETRIVSGIVEQRYQTGQLSVDFEPGFLGRHVATDDTTGAFAATVDNFRAEFLDAIRAGRAGFDWDVPPEESYRKLVLSRGVATVSPAKAAEFRDRLATLMQDMVNAEYEEEDGVLIEFLGIFYAPTD